MIDFGSILVHFGRQVGTENPIGSDQIQVRADQTRSNLVRSGQIRSDQVRSGQIRSDQVRSG